MARKNRLVELRAKGTSYAACARILRTGKNTVVRWGHELEREISALKAVELEALHERVRMHREGRIKLLHSHFERLRKEIEARDLQDVPTGKVLELLLSYFRELKAEVDACRPTASPRGMDPAAGADETTAWITQEIARLYRLYDAKDLGHDEFRERVGMLMLLLKAREQTAVEAKLADLEARVAGIAS